MRRADAAAVLVVGLALGSVALTARVQEEDRVRKCAANLAGLWKAQLDYAVNFGGPDREFVWSCGPEFWESLRARDESVAGHFQCPVEDIDDHGCDYRGPCGDPKLLRETDPVGADLDGNHGRGRGGNVLLRSGEVRTVKADDALWRAAGERTAGRQVGWRPEIRRATEEQRRALADLGALASAVEMYRELNGRWPKRLEDLVARPSDARFWPEGGFYPGGKIPRDPWGRPYEFEVREGTSRILSRGADLE
jgi:hypothetical protein